MVSAARLPASKSASKRDPHNLGKLLPTACHSAYERRARAKGYTLIAGVDEVGRGCLFGPVCAAAVILPQAHGIRGLHDSKELLPPARQALDKRIRERAIAFAIGQASVAEIDHINIYQASRLAMLRAVQALFPAPDFLLVDFLHLDAELPQRALTKGDAVCHSIAAASILAKVHRDALMLEYDVQYPGYGLASGKGYATPTHRAGLVRLGATPLHRRSFLPVRQLSLFDAPSNAGTAAGAPA